MPKIVSYEQQVGLANAQERSSESTATAGLVGQAVSGLGQQVQNFGEVLHRNEVQDNITKIHEQLSVARNDFDRRTQEETVDGTIDVDKIHQEFQETVNKIRESATTSQGHKYLDEKSLSVGSDIVRTAALHQSQLKGKLAVERWNNSLNVNANTLQSNPAAFESILIDTVSSLEAQVEGGSLSRANAEEMKRKSGEQFAQSAVMGWAAISADTAKAVLDKGVYDKFLNADNKASLIATIRAYKSAEETEKSRLKTLKKEAEEKVSKVWRNDKIDDLYNMKLSGKEILSSPMSDTEKAVWMERLHTISNRQFEIDPMILNDTEERSLLPEDDDSGRAITDQTEIEAMLGSGLSVDQTKRLIGNLDKSSENVARKANKRVLLENARALILVNNLVTGVRIGQSNLANFSNSLSEQEAQLTKAGKDPMLLYNPDAKEYFGKQIPKFIPSAKEQIAQVERSSSISKNGVDVPKRNPGESISDFKKRIGRP